MDDKDLIEKESVGDEIPEEKAKAEQQAKADAEKQLFFE